MAPEQGPGIKAPKIDRRTDVYALGAILYYILVQKAPIVGATMAETLQRIVKDLPLPPRSIDPAIPKSLERICLKALQKKKTLSLPFGQSFRS